MKTIFSRALIALTLALASATGFAGILTNHAENKIVDAVMRGQALGAPATWYQGFDTVACTEAGGGTEVTGGSYARTAIAASLAAWAGTQGAGSTTASSGSSGTTSNNATISLPTPTAPGWGQVVSVRLWDAPTGGNAWFCLPISINKTINEADNPSFPPGSISIQIDN